MKQELQHLEEVEHGAEDVGIVGNAKARAIAAQVPHFFAGDVTPSDHWPVLAVYEI